MGHIPRSLRLPAVALALVLFAAGGLVGCGDAFQRRGGKGDAAGAAPIVAATVNGKPIYISDVEAEATVRGLIREGEEFDPTSDEFYQILEDLIETRLFAMEAETRQLDRNADVRHRLERARELILAGALNDQIRNTALDEAAVERMYREQSRLRRSGREVHLRHALFSTKDAAQAAKRRLDSGASTFEEIAYDLSIDRVSGAEGGDLGFRLPDDLPDTMREAAAATQVGQVTGPFQSQEGWHLLKVEERREEAPPSMASLRPRIEQWLMFEEQRRLVEKLKTQARIERIIEENSGVVAGRDVPAPAAAARRAEARKRDPAQAPMGPGGIAGAATPGAPPAVEAPAAAIVPPGTPPAEPKRRRPPPTTAPANPLPPDPLVPPAPEPAKGDRDT
jgi:peptidyl-prolyl cis-trans isomerase C